MPLSVKNKLQTVFFFFFTVRLWVCSALLKSYFVFFQRTVETLPSCGTFLEFTKVKEKKDLSNLSDVLNHSNETVCLWFFIFSNYLYLYSYQARNKVTEIINKAITHYRDDIDLQNLIDFGQREVKI